jgi:hypothetical protein
MAPRDLDKELEQLRRVAANKACPSCSASAPFGFRDVCVKFATLVCSDCKAAHQARARALRADGAAPRAQCSAFTLPGLRRGASGAVLSALRRAPGGADVAASPLPQAYSHRVKSLGMSTFEAAEVDALAAAGNAAAAATWLGKLTREQVCAMAPAKTAKAAVRIARARRGAATARRARRARRRGRMRDARGCCAARRAALRRPRPRVARAGVAPVDRARL